MSKRISRRFIFIGILLGSLLTHGMIEQTQAHDPAQEMAAAASRFLKSLNADQKAMACFEFDSELRTQWDFLPDKFIKTGPRKGLAIKEMSAGQRVFAHALPAAALSHRGYLETMSIMALEKVLKDIEGRDFRDPGLYYVSIFGTPGAKNAWGWRFEGHHLSINVTISRDQKYSVTPSFFGTNPAVVKEGPLTGVEVLRHEEQLALKLVQSLSQSQLNTALIKDGSDIDSGTEGKPSYEIVTKNLQKVDVGALPDVGICWEQLEDDQQTMLNDLVRAYVTRFRSEILERTDYADKQLAGPGFRFGWLGGTQRGEHHYYCVQSPRFLIEFANSQNNANHIHAVWRDFDGDFGRNLLGEHLKEHHSEGRN